MIKKQSLILLVVALAGCATQTPAPITSAVITSIPSTPTPVQTPVTAPREPLDTAASQAAQEIVRPVMPPLQSIPQQNIPKVLIPDTVGLDVLNKVLPAKMSDRKGWREDIFNAFVALQLPRTAEYFCAALSVIEQESSWQADPVVPGLGKIVWKEIGQRADKYHIPLITVQAALMVPSLDGRSYKARIDALRTEKDMNDLFERMLKDAPDIMSKLKISNPIRTGGPMQVSIDFSTAHTNVWPYPYPRENSIRNEVFTRRGGLYFGIAHLLQYPTSYPSMLYRFADFNAGRHSSRNAAFQLAVSKISKKSIAPDGDLLIYRHGYPSNELGVTQKALQGISGQLGLTNREIRNDLLKEKTIGFESSLTYQRVFDLADKINKKPVAREALPQIRLQSSKITRKLTTAWFAERVNGRYQQCLARQ